MNWEEENREESVFFGVLDRKTALLKSKPRRKTINYLSSSIAKKSTRYFRAVAIGTAVTAMVVPVFGFKFTTESRLCSSHDQINSTMPAPWCSAIASLLNVSFL